MNLALGKVRVAAVRTEFRLPELIGHVLELLMLARRLVGQRLQLTFQIGHRGCAALSTQPGGSDARLEVLVLHLEALDAVLFRADLGSCRREQFN